MQTLPDGVNLNYPWPAAAVQSLPQLIVVGAVKQDGLVYISRQGVTEIQALNTIANVYGPGSMVTCANGEGEGFRHTSGSEYAAAIVGGYAANLLSTFTELTSTPGQMAQQLLNFITRDAVVYAADGNAVMRPGSFSRNGGPRAISNGLTGWCNAPNPIPVWRRDAQNATADACYLPTSASHTSTPTSAVTSTTSASATSSDVIVFIQQNISPAQVDVIEDATKNCVGAGNYTKVSFDNNANLTTFVATMNDTCSTILRKQDGVSPLDLEPGLPWASVP